MTVFNGSDVNVEKYRIFPSMDPRSLVCLSGVNKNAYIALPNNTFFHVLFLEQYPLLGKTQEAFSHLRTYYPKCCWKFACSMSLCGSPFLKREFLQQATPRMIRDLKVKKEGLIVKKPKIEMQLLTLCGHSDEDPNSPLYKAKQDASNFEDAFSRCCNFDREDNAQLLNRLYDEINPIVELIEDKIKDPFVVYLRGPGIQTKADAFNFAKLLFATLLLQEDIVMRLLAVKEGREVQDVKVFENPYLSMAKKSLTKSDWKLSELFDFNCIDNYLTVASLLKEELKDGIVLPFLNMAHSKSYLEHLNKEKNVCSAQLTNCIQEISHIEQQLGNCERFNQLLLLTELCFIKNLKEIAYNDDCISYVNITNRKLNDNPNINSTGHLFELLNSEPVWNNPNFIRQILFHDFANGTPKFEWLQDHWKEFLPELKCISMRLESLLNSYAEASSQDFALSMTICLDMHFDTINKILPYLKEMQKRLKECDAAEPKQTRLDLFEMIDYSIKLSPHVSRLLLKRDGVSGIELYLDMPVSELLPMVTSLIEEIERRQDVQ